MQTQLLFFFFLRINLHFQLYNFALLIVLGQCLIFFQFFSENNMIGGNQYCDVFRTYKYRNPAVLMFFCLQSLFYKLNV